jgi:hypothetical protein
VAQLEKNKATRRIAVSLIDFFMGLILKLNQILGSSSIELIIYKN